MTTNSVHFLASGRPAAQLVLAERSQGESEIAARAIRRRFPDLEVRPVTNLAEAESVLTCRRPETALVASGLDGKTYLETIRWFDRMGCGIVVAMLKDRDGPQGKKRSRPGHPTSAASLSCWSHSCGTNSQQG